MAHNDNRYPTGETHATGLGTAKWWIIGLVVLGVFSYAWLVMEGRMPSPF